MGARGVPGSRALNFNSLEAWKWSAMGGFVGFATIGTRVNNQSPRVGTISVA